MRCGGGGWFSCGALWSEKVKGRGERKKGKRAVKCKDGEGQGGKSQNATTQKIYMKKKTENFAAMHFN